MKFMLNLKLFIIVTLFFFMGFTSLAFAKSAQGLVSQANKSFNAAQYDDALRLYNEALISNPDSPEINYNMGSAHFKKGDYENAVKSFEKAAVTGNKLLESKVNYNIAQCKYKLGKLKENTDLENTVKLLQSSLDYYKRAIELNPRNKRAKINHELVEKELKQLLDKLKQQAKKDGQKNGQDQNQQKGDKNKDKQNAQEDNKPQEEKQEDKTEEKKQAQAQNATQQEEINKEKQQKKDVLQPEEQQSYSTQNDQNGAKGMNHQEAKMLLDNYGQEENTGGKLQDNRKDDTRDVLKDW